VHAGPDADFTTVRGVLQTVAKHLGRSLDVTEANHASFGDACGRIHFNDEPVGCIGAVKEDVRKNWDVTQPVAAFELDLDTVYEQFDE
jgi:phenylalanyl-tRNA synthetase beta subunit